MKVFIKSSILFLFAKAAFATGVDLNQYINDQNKTNKYQLIKSSSPQGYDENNPSPASEVFSKVPALDLHRTAKEMLVNFEKNINNRLRLKGEKDFANRIFNENMQRLSDPTKFRPGLQAYSALSAAEKALEADKKTDPLLAKTFLALFSDVAIAENNQRNTALTKEGLVSAFKDFSSNQNSMVAYYDIVSNYHQMMTDSPAVTAGPNAMKFATEEHFLTMRASSADAIDFLKHGGLVSVDSAGNVRGSSAR